MANQVLVVDSDRSIRYALAMGLRSAELSIVCAGSGRQALAIVDQQTVDAVVLDISLPDMSGFDLFQELRKRDARLPVIMMTAYASTETAIEAMRCGAFEYLTKPFDLAELQQIIENAVEVNRMAHVPVVIDADRSRHSNKDQIVGKSPAMQEVYKRIGRVAPQNVAVLIEGESGTGKELIARAIYQYSPRSQGPFLAINCAAIPDGLLESELFGHERGAFTGADRQKIGKFEQADGGTLFLDEVGDLPFATQVKLLRALQEQRFERVGGTETIHTDVRVVAATHQNLNALVAAQRFRLDLYFRLRVFPITIPPLRARHEDIPELVNYFVTLFNRQLTKNVRSVTTEVLDALVNYDWPGNVRELQSVIKAAMVHTTGNVLAWHSLDAVGFSKCMSGQEAQGATVIPNRGYIAELLTGRKTDIYRLVHSELDKVLLQEILRHANGNQVDAATLLGISRTTLRSKLRSLGMAAAG